MNEILQSEKITIVQQSWHVLDDDKSTKTYQKVLDIKHLMFLNNISPAEFSLQQSITELHSRCHTDEKTDDIVKKQI